MSIYIWRDIILVVVTTGGGWRASQFAMEPRPPKPKPGKESKPNLEDWQREEVFRCLLEASYHGKLPPATVSGLADEYQVSRQTIP